MAKQIDIRRGKSEAFRHHFGRKPVYEGGPEGLIAALPGLLGMQEEGIVHADFISYDVYKVKYEVVKTIGIS
jgi:hypothetical protein